MKLLIQNVTTVSRKEKERGDDPGWDPIEIIGVQH